MIPVTDEQKKQDQERRTALKKWRRRALVAGALLALVCRHLPIDYQAPCEAIAQLCTGGFP